MVLGIQMACCYMIIILLHFFATIHCQGRWLFVSYTVWRKTTQQGETEKVLVATFWHLFHHISIIIVLVVTICHYENKTNQKYCLLFFCSTTCMYKKRKTKTTATQQNTLKRSMSLILPSSVWGILVWKTMIFRYTATLFPLSSTPAPCSPWWLMSSVTRTWYI